MSDKHQKPGKGAESPAGEGDRTPPITIKKYANRRLYNTATSSYVTLEHLCAMVKEGVEFVVYDAKTGDDITRSVLTQIIVEEEAKGSNMLPIPFLRQLIGFYGGNMQPVVPRYLEHMMQAFADNQDRMRQQMQDTMSGMFPFSGNFEAMGKQNAQLFENALKMFTPFAQAGEREASQTPGQRPQTPGQRPESAAKGAPGGAPAGGAQAGGGQAGGSDSIELLRQQFDQLQRQLDALSRQQGGDETPATPQGDRNAGRNDAAAKDGGAKGGGSADKSGGKPGG